MMERHDERGSTIITGIVIVLIIFIVLGTALAIAVDYQKRSVYEHARKQAYLNGISVVDAIAGQLSVESQSSFYLPQSTSQPLEISKVNLPDGLGGDISVVIKYDQVNSNLLYIQVTSIYNHQTEEVQLTMQKHKNIWYKKVYSQIGDEFHEESE